MSLYSEFSPVPKYGIPYKRGSSAYYDWLKEEIYRIENGYQVGGTKITGAFYFFLNHFKLLHIDEEAKNQQFKLISPYLADVKKEMYDIIEDCKETGDDLYVIKGRDKGLSYDLAALHLRETQFFKYSTTCGIFPGGENKALVNFKDKYDTAWSAMITDMRHMAGIINNDQQLKYGHYVTLEDGTKEARGILTSMTLLKAVNADVAKSGRYRLMTIDEMAEIHCLTDLLITNQANMRKGGFKTGFTLAAGTSNSFNKGYAQVRSLVYNPEAYGGRLFVIPAQRAYWGWVDYKTGKSDEEGAKADILENRKRLEERNDPEARKKLIIHKQNYPLNLEEMFTANSKSPYDAEVLSGQIGRILSDKSLKNAVKRGNLYAKYDPETKKWKAEWNEEQHGRWQIFLHPKDDLVRPDVGGVDSYRYSDAANSDSMGAIVIYRPFQGVDRIGNLPVCIYHHRPKDKTLFFEDVWLTQLYYNSMMLIERTDEDIFKYLIERGAMNRIKRKPRLVHGMYSKTNNNYGIDASPHNIAMAAEFAATEFTKNHGDILFVDLLDELSKFDFNETNTDLAFAYHWAVLHAMDEIKVLTDFKKNKEENKKGIRMVAVSDGRGGFIVRDKYRQTSIKQ